MRNNIRGGDTPIINIIIINHNINNIEKILVLVAKQINNNITKQH